MTGVTARAHQPFRPRLRTGSARTSPRVRNLKDLSLKLMRRVARAEDNTSQLLTSTGGSEPASGGTEDLPMNRVAVIALFLLPSLACGGATSADVIAYQQRLSELQAGVITHQTDAASTTARADCFTEHQRYDELARPLLQRMTSTSVSMDDCGRRMGMAGPFMMQETCASMQSELDRHAAVACTDDVALNHAEAARHCDRMRTWLSSESEWTGSMMNRDGMASGRCLP